MSKDMTAKLKDLRVCPLTKAICDEKCAWRYKLDTKQSACAVVYLVELLRSRTRML